MTDTVPPIPYSEHAEKAVLGCMLAEPREVLPLVENALVSTDLFVPAHREIFDAIIKLQKSGSAIDVTTVHQYLTDRKVAESGGSPGVLAELITGYSSHLNVGTYIKSVKDKSTLRGLHVSAVGILRDIDERPDMPSSVLDSAVKAIAHATKAPATGANDQVVPWDDALDRSVMLPTEIEKLNLPKRPAILGDWFHVGDLGFIYGARGLGKTWLAIHMANTVAAGGRMGPWAAPSPQKVLYVDGEMAVDASLERAFQLAGGRHDNLLLLHHEVLFFTTGKVLNLTSPEVQMELTAKCVKEGVSVLFLDNISCLFSLKENESDDWGQKILPWLLDLRRKRIAVVFVHHAGRNGNMRGTSKREDAAFWSIKLTEAKGDDQETGARFVAAFDKNRNSTNDETPPLHWHFEPQPDGSVTAKFKPLTDIQVFVDLVNDGMTSCTDIAQEMNVSKGTVSRLAKKAIESGLIRMDGRDYMPKR